MLKDLVISIKSGIELIDGTLISGFVADQAALHGLMIEIRDLNLPLISVHRIKIRN